MTTSKVLAAAVLMAAAAPTVQAQTPNRVDPQARPQVRTVVVVGCAARGAAPHIWALQRVGAEIASAGTAASAADREAAAKQPFGATTYELVGIADFVTNEDSLAIGNRKDLYSLEQVNATGALVPAAKVAVKGMVVSQSPPRINVTSVLRLADKCPEP